MNSFQSLLDTFENYLHEDLIRNDTNRVIELDVYLPNERLAFEYQGEHHYHDIYAIGGKWGQKQQDEEKRRKCAEKDITLIEIPYWWNHTKSSLIATIHKYRPDLISSSIVGDGTPIENKPEVYVGSYILFVFFLTI